jgi:hypothetical protein
MSKHRVKPVYFLPILLRAHGESNPEKHIELSIAGVREKDKIATIKGVFGLDTLFSSIVLTYCVILGKGKW